MWAMMALETGMRAVKRDPVMDVALSSLQVGAGWGKSYLLLLILH